MKARRSSLELLQRGQHGRQPLAVLLKFLARRLQRVERRHDRLGMRVDRLAAHRQHAMDQADARRRHAAA